MFKNSIIALALLLTVACGSGSIETTAATQSGPIDILSQIDRAIESCSLPNWININAEVVANQVVHPLTPDANGDSASIVLTLETGDEINLNIYYLPNADYDLAPQPEKYLWQVQPR